MSFYLPIAEIQINILVILFFGFLVVLGAPGAPFGGSEAKLGTCRVKSGAVRISVSPFGHKKWSPELPRRSPENPKIGPSSPEIESKRPIEVKTVKTSKTTTLSRIPAFEAQNTPTLSRILARKRQPSLEFYVFKPQKPREVSPSRPQCPKCVNNSRVRAP